MKILLVDDSKAMRMLIVRTLREAGFGDHTFLEAGDGFEAFALVGAEQPDLVLSDWAMAEVSGVDLLRGLRSSGNAVPFGFITAQGGEARRTEALEAGAQFLVGKPFTAETLAAALSTCVQA
jgi:two-component system chemotaxis response regulator CheY